MILRWKSPVTFAKAIYHSWLYWRAGRPVIAPEAVIAGRSRTCAGCDKNTGGDWPQCRQCTCFIEAKVLLSAESCPHGYWKQLTSDEDNSKTGQQP